MMIRMKVKYLLDDNEELTQNAVYEVLGVTYVSGAAGGVILRDDGRPYSVNISNPTQWEIVSVIACGCEQIFPAP